MSPCRYNVTFLRAMFAGAPEPEALDQCAQRARGRFIDREFEKRYARQRRGGWPIVQLDAVDHRARASAFSPPRVAAASIRFRTCPSR